MESENKFAASLIAPCGMNCGICLAYLRDKNRCKGCRSENEGKPRYCLTCKISTCNSSGQTTSCFCYDCLNYPCKRLKQLDERYKKKYKMSMIENLDFIKNSGIANFLENEISRWTCNNCGEIICVHREFCLSCKRERFI